jgi:hypothetical protein
MSTLMYNSFMENLAKGIHDLDNHTFYMALLCSGQAPVATDTVYNPASSSPGIYEVKGVNDPNTSSVVGYTAGGKQVTLVITRTTGVTKVTLSEAVSWTSATFTARAAFIYNVSASNLLVAAFDFGTDKSVSNGTFQISANSAGLFTIQQG